MPKSKELFSRPPLVRMAAVHEELQSGQFPNCRKLAEALECSAKTILRDIDFMRDRLGLPIVYDPQKFGFSYEAETAPRLFPWSR